MTAIQASRLQAGQRVRFAMDGSLGVVTEADFYSFKVKWDDGTERKYWPARATFIELAEQNDARAMAS